MTCWQQNGGLIPAFFAPATPTCCCDAFSLRIQLPVLESKVKDDEFVRNVAQDAVSRLGDTIDTKRIYLAGFSAGCVFALGFAATNADLVAAVGCHAGLFTTPPSQTYTAVPIWTVHGLLDEILPYQPSDLTGLGLYSTLGKERELDYLGNLNNCDEAVVTDDTTWAPNATLMTRTNCDNGADVQLFTVATAGHEPFIDYETTIDTTKLAWDFLSKHSKSSPPDLNKDAVSPYFVFDPLLILFGILEGILRFVEFISGLFG